MKNRGVSLIEVLVVIAIFAILGILVSRVVLITLRGTSKGDSIVSVRSAVDYSLAIIERQIRNAKSITTCSTDKVEYLDENGSYGSFSCYPPAPSTTPSPPYVASGSANSRLTGVNIDVKSCSFSCTLSSGNIPPSVTVNITAQNYGGNDTSSVTSSTTIYLRTY